MLRAGRQSASSGHSLLLRNSSRPDTQTPYERGTDPSVGRVGAATDLLATVVLLSANKLPRTTLTSRRRVRSVRALQGAQPRQDCHADLAPLLQRAHGRSHRRAERRHRRSGGTHAELLQQRGRYAELFDLRAVADRKSRSAARSRNVREGQW